jgi:phosphatidate cytidylyltransferase
LVAASLACALFALTLLNRPETSPSLAWVSWSLVVIAVLPALYLGVRLELDRTLFQRLAEIEVVCIDDLAALDRAMLEIGLIGDASATRSLPGRVRGLFRLLGWLGGIVALQVVALGCATLLPITISADALMLTQIVAAFLVLGTGIGLLLKWTVAKGRPHAVFDNIIVRVNAWWVIAGLVGAAFLAGTFWVYLLFAAASMLALKEYLTAGGGNPFAFRRLTAGLLLCVLGVSFAPALLMLELPDHAGRGGFLLMFLLLVTQLSDVFQFIWGKLLGRHKLAPRISPSKTVEGLVGGVLSASALGAALAWMTPFSPMQAALLALGITLLGVAGGLLLSAEKRRRGIKDWGTLVPGHGGALDRLDSLCLSAPGFYWVVKVGWG